MHRLLIHAALADGKTVINTTQTKAEDIQATIACLKALGAEITPQDAGLIVTPINRATMPKNCVLPCNESGSTLRFMLPVVCALGVHGTFQMAGRLPKRPMEILEEQLIRHGITLTRPSPTTLHCKGRLTNGHYALQGDISSQYITGLMMALPLVDGSSKLTVYKPIESLDYIKLTLKVANAFKLKYGKTAKNSITTLEYTFEGKSRYVSPSEIDVEGDWSNAAFWLCAGAMPGGSITMRGMKSDSTQGDKKICDILKQMGANVTWQPDRVLDVSHNTLCGTEIVAYAIPDLVPVLAAVAAVSEGVTTVKKAKRLRIKESDRLMTTTKTLSALGAKITEEESGLTIEGVPALKGGTVDAFGDHRIAMMAAIASAVCAGPVIITGAEAVNKSYPNFWEDLAKLGKKVSLDE